MAITYDNESNDIRCLSTDTKPTDVAVNTLAYETDTGNIYTFNGTTWVITSSGSGGGGGTGTVTSVNNVEPDDAGNVELNVGVLTVNSTEPDSSGNVDVDIGVATINGVEPDENGNVAPYGVTANDAATAQMFTALRTQALANVGTTIGMGVAGAGLLVAGYILNINRKLFFGVSSDDFEIYLAGTGYYNDKSGDDYTFTFECDEVADVGETTITTVHYKIVMSSSAMVGYATATSATIVS